MANIEKGLVRALLHGRNCQDRSIMKFIIGKEKQRKQKKKAKGKKSIENKRKE